MSNYLFLSKVLLFLFVFSILLLPSLDANQPVLRELQDIINRPADESFWSSSLPNNTIISQQCIDDCTVYFKNLFVNKSSWALQSK